MGFAKRIVGFFHNFVVMKRSIRFLPPRKRQDLQQLAELIRENVKQVEMIILFGSYAKNKYVDYDQRIEFGTPTYYMSDYDIAIVTRKPIGAVGVFVVRKDQGSLLREQAPIRSSSTTVSTTSTIPCRKPTTSRRRSSATE